MDSTSGKESYETFERRCSPDEVLTLLTTKGSKASAISCIDKTFLATGFGMRNVESLDRALKDTGRKKKKNKERIDKTSSMLLAHSQKELGAEEEYFESERYLSDVTSQTESISTTLSSTSSSSKESSASKRLEYLMGLVGASSEENVSLEEWKPSISEQGSEKQLLLPPPITSETMRQAQKYLRTHKIFEFYQFLIAHLLSAVPDNAIEFITDMLSKCLMFRSGYGEPPLLYNRKHIEELFNLMDPMRTGYINYNQYKAGMQTLGICGYDTEPQKNEDGCISKETFVEEAYECLTELLTAMIRSRGIDEKAPNAPPPSPVMQTVWNGGSEGSYASSAKAKEKE